MTAEAMLCWFFHMLLAGLISAQKLQAGNAPRAPVIFIPTMLGSILKVEVSRQQEDIENCPRDGSYELYYGMAAPAGRPRNFSEACMYKLAALDVEPDSGPLGNYQNKRGVTVWLPDVPMPTCLAPMYQELGVPDAFSNAGYMAGEDVRYFCYDWRLAPETAASGSADDRTPVKQLEQIIRDMARESGRKVWLVGHSYGCTVALATVLALGKSAAEQYVAGIVMVSPVLSGSPMMSFSLFSGVSLVNMKQFPEAAPVWESWPAVYTLLPSPDAYNTMVVLVTDVESDNGYTVDQLDELFVDSHMDLAQKLWRKLIGRYTPRHVTSPVPVHAFTVYGVDTAVGVEVHGMHSGQRVRAAEYMDGDGVVDEVCSNELFLWRKSGGGKVDVTEVNTDHFKVMPQVMPHILRLVNADNGEHSELR